MIFPELTKREQAGQTIRVGIVGAGQMGEGLVCQMQRMAGMKAAAVADIDLNRAVGSYRSAGIPEENIVCTDQAGLAAAALEEGKVVATTNSALISTLPAVDVVVEATGIPEVGARVALDTILNRKHIVNMNVETDATTGFILRRMAKAAGVVYTLTAGDEPGAAMELFDFATSLGFEVICAGKGKNNPLDISADPDSVAEEARRKQMNPKMLAGFKDGTKTMVEMTSLGNAIGFVPDVRGMRGSPATPKTIDSVFVPAEAGGVLTKPHVVEYCNGIAPGVFVTFTTDNPKIVRDLVYLQLGKGPYWALYRPYHLANLETPLSIARAILYADTTVATDRAPVVEAIAIAKRDLKAGERIDSLGGYSIHGSIDTAETARREDLLPLGLAPGARLVRDIPRGQAVAYSDVELDNELTIVQLRRLQDQALKSM